MEIPNLSLNSTFSVPLFEHQQHYEEEEVLPSSTMCNYTLYTKECGHKVEDHVENGDCPYFQRTQVPCDRDNSKIRDRWTVKDIPRNGICNNCLRDAHNSEEDAMRREQEKMRAQDLRDAEEKEAQLRRAQEELREKNWKENEEAKKQRRRAEEEVEAKRRADEQARKNKLATARAREETKVKAMEQTRLEAEAKEQEEFERAMRQSQAEHEANLAADIQEAERQSKAEIARQAKIREDEDYKFMVAKSLAEAERQRQQQEANEMARALRESAQFRAPPRNYQDEVYTTGTKQLGGGWEKEWHRKETTTITETIRSPSPPARAPAQAVFTPPPTPPAPAPAPKVKPSTIRPPPPPKATPPKPTDYTLPAVGSQTYGHLRLGQRAMPVHESQAIPDTPTGPAQPLSPTVPSKPVRLGGAIAAADMHIVREAKPSMPGPNATAGFFPLKMTAGPRKVPPPVPHKGGITGQDPKLAAILAKKREWEPVEEDAAPVLPSQSASKAQPPSPPVRSASAEARRLAKEDFDKGRMTGWKKDEE